MTRRVEIVPLESGFVVKAWAQTEAEAFALQSALANVPPARAFTPGLARGEAFDAPEVPRTPDDYPPEGVNGWAKPPNCDGGGYAEPTTGEMLAQAQHIAAEDGDGCTSAVCAMTRGAGD